MNKAIILQILALSGEFIASVTPEWCTVMQSVYKTRIVTVQDTVQQIRRHYFWRNSFENIPINYTRIEVSRSHIKFQKPNYSILFSLSPSSIISIEFLKENAARDISNKTMSVFQFVIENVPITALALVQIIVSVTMVTF